MSRRTMFPWLIGGLVLVGWTAAWTPASPSLSGPQTPAALAEARLSAVRRVYELKKELRSRGEAGIEPEQDYLWSRRLLEAERDASGKKHEDLPALEAHLDRMKQLEALAKQSYRAGETTALQAAATEFYRTEAEYWLALANAK